MALLLFLEASVEATLSDKAPFGWIGRRHLRHAAAALELAVTYYMFPEYYHRLAEVYARLGGEAWNLGWRVTVRWYWFGPNKVQKKGEP